MTGALTLSGSIEFGLHVDRCEVDVARCGVDVGMPKEGLHHGEIDAGFGERGAERVTERMRMTAWNSSRRPVIAKDGPQTGRSERLPAAWSFCHHEQPTSRCLWPLGQQVGLDDTRHVHVKGDTAFFGSFAADTQPSSPDVHIGHVEGEHLAGTEPAKDHQSRNGPVPPCPQAPNQRNNFVTVECTREPLGFSKPQG